MGLQIRLVHALGDQLVELEPHPDGTPLVVGRAQDADVVIPSLNVSRKHVLLYRYEGGWAMQDTGGGRGTLVNGHPVTGAVCLSAEDVVALGSDPVPVTLVIDPYGTSNSKAAPGAVSAKTVQGGAVKAGLRSKVQEAEPAATSGATQSPRPVQGGGAARSLQPKTAPQQPAVPRPTRPVVAAVSPVDTPSAEEYPAPESAENDWMGTPSPVVTRPAARKKNKKRKQGLSPLAIVATLLLSGGIIGGAYWAYLYHQKHSNPVVTVVTVDSSTSAGKPQSTGNVFNDVERDRMTKAVDPTTLAKPADTIPDKGMQDASSESPRKQKMDIVFAPEFAHNSTPKIASAAGTGGVDNTKKSKAPTAQQMLEADLGKDASMAGSGGSGDASWSSVEDAHASARPVDAIVIYGNYLAQTPNSPHLGEVNRYTDEALDLLWWNRITDLMTQRENIKKDMTRKDRDIAAETTSDFKKTLAEEKDKLAQDLETVKNQLAQMKYSADADAPSLSDAAAMKVLRAKRDVEVFLAWSEKVYQNITTSRGAKVF